MKWGYVSYHFLYCYINYCILCNEKAKTKPSWAVATLLDNSNRRKIIVPSMVCFLSRVLDRTWAFQLTTCGNHMETTWLLVTCQSCIAPIIWTLINNNCYGFSMDNTQESDALRWYPLYRTPISRYFNSAFNHTSASPSFISPHYQQPWRSCNCPCDCT
jgi:hypothetical protein